MTLLFLIIACHGLYIFMLWLTMKRQSDKVSSVKWVLQATLGTLCVLLPVLFIDKILVLFLTVIMIFFALYIGAHGSVFGRLSRQGIFGGVCLAVPCFFYYMNV